MRNPDQWLLETVFEPVAHRIEAHTGINNFALSRYSLMLFVWYVALYTYRSPAPATIVSTILMLGVIGIAAWFTLRMERQSEQRGNAFINPQRDGWSTFWLHYILGCMTADVGRVFFLDWFEEGPRAIGTLGVLLHMYFLACNRMPPGYREELEARRGKLATVEA